MAKVEEKPKKRGNFLTILVFALTFLILFDNNLREATGRAVGYVFDPVIGFDHEYPVLTVMIAGTLMVLITTAIRHFTTDWLQMAKFQSYMRAFQKEFAEARKANNTYKVKKLTDQQPKMMEKQQKVSAQQMKTMPFTMIVVIPLFAWLLRFLTPLPYPFFSAPWNATVEMFGRDGILFGTSVFPHWILLYMTVSIPLGALVQKSMKYLSWKERWQPKHPDVHEAHPEAHD